ncbi:MAG: 2-succinyl-5-enolpyruvyl-6-hydroxy-3-cyclohexene-1-carboxylic-acid synthase [Actinomycetota bacterium]
MSLPNPSTAFASAVIDELARGGVSLAVAAPGSRSTALVLAAEAHPAVELVMAIDERSAAFHALGGVKADGGPAAVITTSGTAVANLLPAVVEADMAGCPLVVLSADRPPELRGVGANQAIDQGGLLGRSVRIALDLGPPEARSDAPRYWRSSVSQVLGFSRGFSGRPGPVHLNLAFREPTVAVSDDGRSRDQPFPHPIADRESGPWTDMETAKRPSPELVERLAGEIAGSRRGMILAGAGLPAEPSIAALGRKVGWPVLATAESGLRGEEGVVASAHHLAGRVEGDLIVRFGSPGPSRRIVDLVSGRSRQIVVASTWSDPGREAELVVDAEAGALADALLQAVDEREPDEWGHWWGEADRAVQTALAPELERGVITEPAMAWAAGRSRADVLTVASSMPIRDVEAFAFVVPPIVANRGASGIDGLVSTALGAARHARSPLALTGDISLLHDANGFLMEPRPDCVFLVADNAGGGIFSFLPQREHADASFERLFATPPRRDLRLLAEFHHLQMHEVDSVSNLEKALDAAREGGSHLIVGRTDRDQNVAEHARLNRLAGEAISAVPLP